MFGGGPIGQDEFAGDEEQTTVHTPPMMRFPPIVAHAFRSALRLHYPSRCTIQLVSSGDTPSGQQVSSGGLPIAGHLHIPCALGAFSKDTTTDSEKRGPMILEEFSRRICKLNGYYPSIVERQMQAVVDGVTYSIRGVESDSQHVSTRLYLEVITPRKLV